MAWTKWMATQSWKQRKKKTFQSWWQVVSLSFYCLLFFLASTVKSRISGSTFTKLHCFSSKQTVDKKEKKKTFYFESRLNLKWTTATNKHQSTSLVEMLKPLVRKCSQLPYILFSEQSHLTLRFEIQNEINVNVEMDSSYNCYDSVQQSTTRR